METGAVSCYGARPEREKLVTYSRPVSSARAARREAAADDLMDPAGGVRQGGQAVKRGRIRAEPHGVEHHVGGIDSLQQLLIGDAGTRVIGHRV